MYIVERFLAGISTITSAKWWLMPVILGMLGAGGALGGWFIGAVLFPAIDLAVEVSPVVATWVGVVIGAIAAFVIAPIYAVMMTTAAAKKDLDTKLARATNYQQILQCTDVKKEVFPRVWEVGDELHQVASAETITAENTQRALDTLCGVLAVQLKVYLESSNYLTASSQQEKEIVERLYVLSEVLSILEDNVMPASERLALLASELEMVMNKRTVLNAHLQVAQAVKLDEDDSKSIVQRCPAPSGAVSSIAFCSILYKLTIAGDTAGEIVREARATSCMQTAGLRF